jgi:hypothetical protein
MRGFGKRVDGLDGRRRAPRDKVVLAASALSIESSTAVVVTDVSTKGAKLLGKVLPSRGASVLISVGDVEFFAKVAWCARDECGVDFETPLDPARIKQIKHNGRWSKVMGVPNAD